MVCENEHHGPTQARRPKVFRTRVPVSTNRQTSIPEKNPNRQRACLVKIHKPAIVPVASKVELAKKTYPKSACLFSVIYFSTLKPLLALSCIGLPVR